MVDDLRAAARGNGSELEATGGHRPKFRSAFSSCTLSVTSFSRVLGAVRPSSSSTSASAPDHHL
jgi:hypothetical protein